MTRMVLVVIVLLGGQAFEVASVRPSAPLSRRVPTLVPRVPSQFVAMNWSIRTYVAFAYGIAGPGRTTDRVRGGDPAVLEQRFDITATYPPDIVIPVSEDDQRTLVRALLVDRFGLRAHVEREVLPAAVLRRASDTLGPQMRPLDRDCGTWRWTGGVMPTDAAGEPLCPSRGAPVSSVAMQVGASSDMAFLIRMLQPYVMRPLVDETGLAGSFAWIVTFNAAPERTTVRQSPHPELAVALREQLGLELVSTSAEVDVVVIDAVSEPEPN